MAIVSAKDMLIKAHHNHYGVAQININNLEWVKAVITTCEQAKSPVIIGVSEGAAKYMGGFKTVVDLVTNIYNFFSATIPLAIHLDHGSYQGSIDALKAGFTSVMFDGSHYSFEENIKKTSDIVNEAKKYNASVEAEVGTIGGEEDGVVGSGELADPQECKILSEIGIDFLAAGIGNIHGQYPKNWKGLDFDVLEAVQKTTNGIPLVLHGGTGIPAKMVQQAISLGVAKINVNTELQLAFADAVAAYCKADKYLDGKGFDPRKLLHPGVEAMQRVIQEKLEIFGSINKA